MIQALHAILGQESSSKQGNKGENARPTKVTMLYGSQRSDDILGRDLLDKWSSDHADVFECVHVLSNEPTDGSSNWTGARGFIDRALLEQHGPDPSTKFIYFVCGPPPMYAALAGPREDKEVSGLLKELGYSSEHVYKF
jgi:cytochrome-b5 reductase